jgi:hypothetical protein
MTLVNGKVLVEHGEYSGEHAGRLVGNGTSPHLLG